MAFDSVVLTVMNEVTAKDVVSYVTKALNKKFSLTCQERFSFDGTFYIPDIVLRNQKGDIIRAIIEIEKCSRKHVVGGVITADYCMGLRNENPVIFILSLEEKNKKDYRNRIKMLKTYVRNLQDVIIGNKEEVISELVKMEA